MITYNHEKFIAQAIESVLMQKTPFPIELVIGEDCSPDGTRAIVKRYAAAHPEIIRALLPETNLGAPKNMDAVLKASRGKYLAILEGDDYWTDPEKLRLQVEFMEKHPDCAICHHRVDAVDEKTHQNSYQYPPPEWRGEWAEADSLLHTNFIQTCSALYRRSRFPAIPESMHKLKVADWAMGILASRGGGRIGYIDRLMAVYRLHAGSSWQAKPYEERCFYTLEMFEAVEGALAPKERARTAAALQSTILRLAGGCSPRGGRRFSRGVASFCLKRALRPKAQRRLALLRRALWVGILPVFFGSSGPVATVPSRSLAPSPAR
jgi:glycosyltransferase involved in cell wall biosynthesis